jgi:glycine cleavage system aminomethyltransferase T
MLEVRGHVKKKLVQLLVEGDQEIPPGAEITAPDGAVVGAVTSSGVRGQRAIALGHVKYKYIAPGTELQVGGRAAVVGP